MNRYRPTRPTCPRRRAACSVSSRSGWRTAEIDDRLSSVIRTAPRPRGACRHRSGRRPLTSTSSSSAAVRRRRPAAGRGAPRCCAYRTRRTTRALAVVGFPLVDRRRRRRCLPPRDRGRLPIVLDAVDLAVAAGWSISRRVDRTARRPRTTRRLPSRRRRGRCRPSRASGRGRGTSQRSTLPSSSLSISMRTNARAVHVADRVDLAVAVRVVASGG